MVELRLDVAVPLRSFELHVALDVGAETVAVVGPSGAGKSTLLRAVAGLIPARGHVHVNERVTRLGHAASFLGASRRQGMASSSVRASASTSASAKGLPAIWTPMGSPSAVNPAGRLAAG